MNNKAFIEQLYKNRKLSSDKEYDSFETAIKMLQERIEISDISDIIKVFCDDTSDDEVMFGLVHIIEQFVGEDYLKYIAVYSPDMAEAHEWAMTLNRRIINSPRYFSMYINVIRNLDEDQKSKIISLLTDIKNDDPEMFGEKVDLILKEY